MDNSPHLLSLDELALRHTACQKKLIELVPDAQGFMVFSRLNIYYLTGTLANALFWLPREGEPILFVRKSLERAKIESPLRHILPFRSYSEITTLLFSHAEKTPLIIACEKSGLPWHMAEMLMSRMPGISFVAGDPILQQVRAIKNEEELAELRFAGQQHFESVCRILPGRIHSGMTEREIGMELWNISFQLGHGGAMRMAGMGEEAFLGHISAGTSAIYPSHFNGPLGVRGTHPATPFMGSSRVVWKSNMLLGIDTNFVWNGYNTDKTQIFFSGPEDKLPLNARLAHEVCIDVETTIASQMKPGAIPSELYTQALSMVEAAGFSKGFMGNGSNKVPFLGHGIGLNVDEWPVIAAKFDSPLQEGMVIALEPKIGLSGLGMVGSENTYEVTAKGGKSLTGPAQNIICLTK